MDNEKNDLVAAIEQVNVGTLASCVGLNFGKRDVSFDLGYPIPLAIYRKGKLIIKLDSKKKNLIVGEDSIWPDVRNRHFSVLSG